ncbi:dUTPase [Chloriridovirus anopheles1]|uniref:dUTP diphosphatase n=1 Tax=Chloriridovirus anopheles1 TaxID=1465751 RepID=W8R9R8_9VIRU|nr:dUTPase [Anopheles minimus iridovirus]AHL67601.1 deoxyuridine 5'-triphosphate nucleotidohydrolase [Anopheles minimus iridovirus]
MDINTLFTILIILYLIWSKLNNRKKIKFIMANNKANPPIRGTSKSAGYDLKASEDCVIPARSRKAIQTGVKVILPKNTYGRIASRSGLSFKHGIEVGAGVVDEDYRNSLMVILHNHTDEEFIVKEQDRIAQFIVENVVYPTTFIEDTNGQLQSTNQCIRDVRGKGGFGSTGVQ